MAAYHGLREELQERIREDQRRHWVNPCAWYPLPQRRDGDAGIRPVSLTSFEEFDQRVEACYTDPEANKKQIPSTLEGCVMRISDIIAYLGKDRQDAQKVGVISGGETFSAERMGAYDVQYKGYFDQD